MDEPGEVKAGFDDSIAGEIAARVEQIMEHAERDSEGLVSAAEDEARVAIEAARTEARRAREDAAGRAQAVAATRVRRILELRREIAVRTEELVDSADDPDAVRASVGAFLAALADRADLIARELEAELVATPEPEPEMEPEPEPVAALGNGKAPEQEPDPQRVTEPQPVMAGVVAAAAAAQPLRQTRLSALRMAVAGASRDELEAELCQTLDVTDAEAVLDDVFGRPKSPFPKWGVAVKRAR